MHIDLWIPLIWRSTLQLCENSYALTVALFHLLNLKKRNPSPTKFHAGADHLEFDGSSMRGYVLRESELEFQFNQTKAFRTFSGPAERSLECSWQSRNWVEFSRHTTNSLLPGCHLLDDGSATASKHSRPTGYEPHRSLSGGLAGPLQQLFSFRHCCTGCLSKCFDRFKLFDGTQIVNKWVYDYDPTKTNLSESRPLFSARLSASTAWLCVCESVSG